MRIKLDRLPVPVSVNQMYRPGRRHGSRVLSVEAMRYPLEVLAVVQDYRLEHDRWHEYLMPKRRWMSVAINWHRSNNRRDLDNVLKLLLDGLQAAKVYHNDRWIAHIDIRFVVSTEDYITVEIDGTYQPPHD